MNKVTRLSCIFRFCLSHILLIILAATFTTVCHAQNNPFKINDRLYPVYMKAHANKSNSQGLAMANQLYRQATELGDRKAQCLALTIPVLYYFNNNGNEANFERAVKTLQDRALQTGYTQYFYFGMTNKVNYMLNRHKTYEALLYIQNMEQFAKKHGHAYGVFAGLCALGQVHLIRTEVTLAFKAYKEALDFGLEFLPEQDMSPVYRKLTECFEEYYDWNGMYLCAKEGIERSKNRSVNIRLLRGMALAKLMLDDDEGFREAYDQYVKLNGTKNDPSEHYTYEMSAMKALADRDFDKARQLLDAFPKKFNRYRLRLMTKYHQLTGDYRAMAELQRKLFLIQLTQSDSLSALGFAEMNAKFINQKLEYENDHLEMERQRIENERQHTQLANTKLKLTNTQLTLLNSSLELQRTRSDADLLKLSYYNKQLEAEKLRGELEKEKTEKNFHNTLTWTLVGFMAALFAASTAYTLSRRRILRRLRRANTELEENNRQLVTAKEKAVEADRMKTVFIQNMSHEIRTPLNAIVGFSEVIANSAEDLSPAERADMTDRIHRNTESMLRLVGDVLDTAQIESGTYTTRCRSTSIGEIMRQSIDTAGRPTTETVRLTAESDAPDDFTIHTDVKRVVQVIANMLTNAYKNTERGSVTLGCSLSENPGMVTFSVADTGCGVPHDKAESIFESFKKLDDFKPGLGLGLHICRMIADQLGGCIYVDCEYTGGARFVFAIPQ